MTRGGDGALSALSLVWRPVLAGVVEVGAAAVDPAAGDLSAVLPALDRAGGDAELLGDLFRA